MPGTAEADGKRDVTHHKGICSDRGLSSSGDPTCTNKHREWPAPSSGLMFALASEALCVFSLKKKKKKAKS